MIVDRNAGICNNIEMEFQFFCFPFFYFIDPVNTFISFVISTFLPFFLFLAFPLFLQSFLFFDPSFTFSSLFSLVFPFFLLLLLPQALRRLFFLFLIFSPASSYTHWELSGNELKVFIFIALVKSVAKACIIFMLEFCQVAFHI